MELRVVVRLKVSPTSSKSGNGHLQISEWASSTNQPVGIVKLASGQTTLKQSMGSHHQQICQREVNIKVASGQFRHHQIRQWALSTSC